MSHGPGKYDDACTKARLATGAEGVVLIVSHGQFGDGFAVQVSPSFLRQLPAVLRFMADQIERDLAQGDAGGGS